MKFFNSLKTQTKKDDKVSNIFAEFIKKKLSNGKDFNFDNIDHIRCEQHFELKDNFLLTETKEYHKYDIICSTCLSDLNRAYDDSLRSKLYSGIIYDQKGKILDIKNEKIDFENFTYGKILQNRTHDDILNSGDELVNFTESFEKNVMNKYTSCKTSPEDIKKIKDFIGKILNEKNEPNLRNIGQNEDLKIRYIQLAYFLLRFRSAKENEENHKGLTENLKQHILDLIKKRKKINQNIDNWLIFILGDFYKKSHELENLPYDEEFYRNIQKEFTSQQDETIRELIKENERLKNVFLIFNFFLILVIN